MNEGPINMGCYGDATHEPICFYKDVDGDLVIEGTPYIDCMNRIYLSPMQAEELRKYLDEHFHVQ